LLLVAAVALATVLAAAVPSQGLARRTGPRDDRGFPRFYTDNSGLRLQMCDDGTFKCNGTRAGDLVAPEGEAFYWAAVATIHSKRGPLFVEFALEAAFSDAGRPIVFDRTRIRGHLNRKGTYILGHPYGRNTFRAITPKEQRNVDITQDRMCRLNRKGGCPNGHIGRFLRAKQPPAGYVGAGARLVRVTGGRFRNSLVLRTGQGKVIGRTSKFEIIGKRLRK
jgi:hypothetical protein